MRNETQKVCTETQTPEKPLGKRKPPATPIVGKVATWEHGRNKKPLSVPTLWTSVAGPARVHLPQVPQLLEPTMVSAAITAAGPGRPDGSGEAIQGTRSWSPPSCSGSLAPSCDEMSCWADNHDRSVGAGLCVSGCRGGDLSKVRIGDYPTIRSVLELQFQGGNACRDILLSR